MDAAETGLRDRRLRGFFEQAVTLEKLASLAVHDFAGNCTKLILSVRLSPFSDAQTGSPEAIRCGAEFILVGDFQNNQMGMIDRAVDQIGSFGLDDRVSSLDGALGERKVTAGDAVDVSGRIRWFGLWTP